MVKHNFLFALLLSTVLFACKNSHQAQPVEVMNNDTTLVPLPLRDFKGIKFAMENDVICGMPVTAGVKDTAQYKGKVYGFCSKECKDEFQKNPDAYLTSK